MNYRLIFLLIPALLFALCCGKDSTVQDHHDHDHGNSMALTIWTEELEIFAELDLPVAGKAFHALIHLTDIKTFQPVPRTDTIRVVFSPGNGLETLVEATGLQDGIFEATITVDKPGEGRLLLEIPHEGHAHRTSLGTIEIGTKDHPGHLLSAPREDRVPLASHDHDHQAHDAAEVHSHDDTGTDHQHEDHDKS